MVSFAGWGDVNRSGVLGLCLTLLLCGNAFLFRFLRRQTFFLCLLFGCDAFFFGFLFSGNAFLLCLFLINDLEGQFVAFRRGFLGNHCEGAFLCLCMQDNAVIRLLYLRKRAIGQLKREVGDIRVLGCVCKGNQLFFVDVHSFLICG